MQSLNWSSVYFTLKSRKEKQGKLNYKILLNFKGSTTVTTTMTMSTMSSMRRLISTGAMLIVIVVTTVRMDAWTASSMVVVIVNDCNMTTRIIVTIVHIVHHLHVHCHHSTHHHASHHSSSCPHAHSRRWVFVSVAVLRIRVLLLVYHCCGRICRRLLWVRLIHWLTIWRLRNNRLTIGVELGIHLWHWDWAVDWVHIWLLHWWLLVRSSGRFHRDHHIQNLNEVDTVAIFHIADSDTCNIRFEDWCCSKPIKVKNHFESHKLSTWVRLKSR